MSLETTKEKEGIKSRLEKYSEWFVIACIFAVSIIIEYIIYKYSYTLLDYGGYIGWREALKKPMYMTIVLTIISSIFIFLYKELPNIFKNACLTDDSITVRLLRKLSKGILIINIFVVSMFALFNFGIISPEIYKSFHEDKIRRIAYHESGHCLINELEFPGTSKQVRIFDGPDRNNVNKFLGYEHVNKIPAGLHNSNRDLIFKEDVYRRIKVSLAGMLGEELLSEEGKPSIGASGDIENIKKAVEGLVNNGLTELGPISWDILTPEEKRAVYDEIVTPLYEEAKSQIEENKDKILKLSEVLIEKKKLTGDEARKILDMNTKDQGN